MNTAICFALAVLLCVSAASAQVTPYSENISRVNSNATALNAFFIPPPPGSADGIRVWNGSTNLPENILFTSKFVWNKGTGVLDLTLSAADVGLGSFNGTYASLTGQPTAVSAFTNDASYVTTSAMSSGMAGKMNANPGGTISQYVRGDGTLAAFPAVGTVTSVGLSGSEFSIGSSPVTTSGTITLALATTGVSAGTYANVTVDTKGRVTGGTAYTHNAVSRTSGTSPTSFQPSTTRDAIGFYNVTLSNSVNVVTLATQYAQVELQISPDNSNWTTIGRVRNATTVGLAIALSLTDSIDIQVCGPIPANYYVRLLRTGTGTVTDLAGRELLL